MPLFQTNIVYLLSFSICLRANLISFKYCPALQRLNNNNKSGFASRRQRPKCSDGEEEVHSEWKEGRKERQGRGRGRDLTLMSGSGQPTRAEDGRREGERAGRGGRRRGGASRFIRLLRGQRWQRRRRRGRGERKKLEADEVGWGDGRKEGPKEEKWQHPGH